YAGGDAATANYEATCRGDTGHAEVVRVTYDPAEVSFETLLQVFFGVAHDPTQLNRQGADRGTQYRSAFFYADEKQREVVTAYIKQLDATGYFNEPIATTVEPLTEFFDAEPYHQDFARRNPHQPYVACTALPKIDKMRALFTASV
ncbi:MAG: peptide-methionine (S)-S-oxide reductase MsrA, partial [Planctomycetota bacterium]